MEALLETASQTEASARPAALPPVLPDTWLAPDHCGYLTARDGHALRHGCWLPAGRTLGTVVLLGGRSEFIEKYGMELARELVSRDFSVHSMDWRGQGLSQRLLDDREKGHIDSFDTYVADLELFLAHLNAVHTPRPLIALTHSMGGHIVLRHLSEAGPASPFAAAFNCAPMTGLRREAAIRMALMLLPERKAVEERFFVYGSGPFRWIDRQFAGNRVTHDERRFRFTDEWFGADRRLALGGPTVGWLRQALRSMRMMEAPGYLERVRVPVMVLSAGQDRLVESHTHASVTARIAGAQCLIYPDSGHEIMMETDAIRARFLADFDRFCEQLTRPS